MKLTQKDQEFLNKIREMIQSGDLWVELKTGRPSYMVLKGTYGEKVHKTFGMTRQGVRWRFRHLFNEMYISSFETVLFVEKVFGSQLREHAIRISKERYQLRQEIRHTDFIPAKEMKNSSFPSTVT